jgi:hypothetical protein
MVPIVIDKHGANWMMSGVSKWEKMKCSLQHGAGMGSCVSKQSSAPVYIFLFAEEQNHCMATWRPWYASSFGIATVYRTLLKHTPL